MPKINKGERNKIGSGTRIKREYVKPVIESEEFVANEYVAACWHVSCPKEGSGLLDCHYRSWDIKGFDSVGAYIDAHPSVEELRLIHKGTSDHGYINNEKTDSYYHNTSIDTYHHELTVVSYENYNPDHPNASV